MRAKTIKAILAKVHKEFTDSITDPQVRDLVRENSMVTGGSIVSLLLGEKVNDYDYYFTNRETALAVTRYYVKQFNEATDKGVEAREEDGGRIRVWIQGSGVAAEKEMPPREIEKDTFGHGETEAQDDKPKYRPVFLSSNAITLSDKVQLIIRFYGDPEEIHSNYDFAHCTSYWLSATGELVLPNEALQAILAKELVYRGSKYPLASVIRTRKFIQRGWVINAGQYLKMCMQLSDLDLSNVNVLEDQLTGVDLGYFSQIISLLREKQTENTDFKITMAYVTEIIDRIM